MGVIVKITQSCDICGCTYKEDILTEESANIFEVMGESLVLCHKHLKEKEKLMELLSDPEAMRLYLYDIWKNRNPMWERMER